MWWKSLLVALLVLPPVFYVAGTLYSPSPTPDRRPALVLDDAPPASSPVEPQVTLEPRPRPSRPPGRVDDGGDDRDDDDGGGVTIVRPVPQDVDDDDDGADDDDRDDDDDDHGAEDDD